MQDVIDESHPLVMFLLRLSTRPCAPALEWASTLPRDSTFLAAAGVCRPGWLRWLDVILREDANQAVRSELAPDVLEMLRCAQGGDPPERRPGADVQPEQWVAVHGGAQKCFFARLKGTTHEAVYRCTVCDGYGCAACKQSGTARGEVLHPADTWTPRRLDRMRERSRAVERSR